MSRCVTAAAREAGRLDIAVANAGTDHADGDGSGRLYAAMAQRNAELAEKGSSSTFIDHPIHMGDEGWAGVLGSTSTAPSTRARIHPGAGGGWQCWLVHRDQFDQCFSGEGSAHHCTSKGRRGRAGAPAGRKLAPRGITRQRRGPGADQYP